MPGTFYHTEQRSLRPWLLPLRVLRVSPVADGCQPPPSSSGLTSNSLRDEAPPALAADSQDQGAEHEACEKLHRAAMKAEVRETGTRLIHTTLESVLQRESGYLCPFVLGNIACSGISLKTTALNPYSLALNPKIV